MTRKSRNPNAPYSAYHFRDVPSEDAELTHVGPGTPCGEYLRRFWHPVALSSEVNELPVAVRIMGEDLVVFRDGGNRLGLLQRHCSHRGTSLEFGRIDPRGIRCCYHGWLFDVSGKILETPGEPSNSTLKERLWHGAYPVREYHGLIFAYMGEPETVPDFPVLDTFELTGYRHIYKVYHQPCNWLQVKENCMDPVHTAFLHTIISGPQFTEQFGILPELDWVERPNGMVYIATRRVGDNVWVRINDFILPNIHQFAPQWETAKEERIFSRPMATVWAVPIDDRNTMNIDWLRIHDSLNMSDVEVERQMFGQGGGRPYRERQLIPGDYEAQVSQRPIAVHALEHLGHTDIGVTMLRRILRRQLREAPAPVGGTKGPVPTISQDTVLRVPPAATPEADRELMREVGRRVAEGDYLGREKDLVPA